MFFNIHKEEMQKTLNRKRLRKMVMSGRICDWFRSWDLFFFFFFNFHFPAQCNPLFIPPPLFSNLFVCLFHVLKYWLMLNSNSNRAFTVFSSPSCGFVGNLQFCEFEWKLLMLFSIYSQSHSQPASFFWLSLCIINLLQ